jgi:hypothetical protein
MTMYMIVVATSRSLNSYDRSLIFTTSSVFCPEVVSIRPSFALTRIP